MANIFNPQAFFDKTGHYASQGRGLFTLIHLPTILGGLDLRQGAVNAIWDNFTSDEKIVINTGWALLSNGIMAKSVQTPGHNLATFDEFSFSGPTRKHAHTQLFGPLTVEFFMMGQTPEEAGAIYNTFVLWHEGIAGARLSGNEASRTPISDSTLFAIEYYDNYVSEAELKLFSPMVNPTNVDKEPTPIVHNKYFEIYPQAIGGLNTSWESQDAPMTLSVTFEYFYTRSILPKTNRQMLNNDIRFLPFDTTPL